MHPLRKCNSGYWGYLGHETRDAIVDAIEATEGYKGKTLSDFIQLEDDGYSTVAFNSIAVGIHGISCLGGINVPFLNTYDTEAAAASANLPKGSIYKTSTGELRVKL